MSRQGENPFLSEWILKVLARETQQIESIVPLRLHQMVKGLFEMQALIGWENLEKERVARCIVHLEEWWEGYHRVGKGRLGKPTGKNWHSP